MAAYLIILTLFRTYKIVGDKVLFNMHICIHHVSLTSYEIYGTFKHNTDFFQIVKIKLFTASCTHNTSCGIDADTGNTQKCIVIGTVNLDRKMFQMPYCPVTLRVNENIKIRLFGA